MYGIHYPVQYSQQQQQQVYYGGVESGQVTEQRNSAIFNSFQPNRGSVIQGTQRADRQL